MDKQVVEKIKGLIKELGGLPKIADEEQEIALRLFKGLIERIGQEAIGNWMYCEEWEDTLVPIRLPKGMADQLKMMDSAKADLMGTPECKDCKSNDDCSIIKRNPSEILLTVLMKIAFCEVFTGVAKEEGD